MTTRAAQIELLVSSLIDPTTGGICSGYSVEFYAAGTSTPKNVWTEKEKSNPFTTYTLDSGGKALLYGDGIYKFIVKNLSGTTVLSLDNQKIQSTNFSVRTVVGTSTVTPDDDEILCNGTFTLNLQTVANFTYPVVIKNIGAGQITVDPYGAETIDGSATYAITGANFVLTLYPDVDSNTWRSGYQLNDVASLSYIASGASAVTRNALAKMRESESVVDYDAAGDGTTDDTTALGNADSDGNGTIYYPPGTYLVGSNLTLTRAIRMDPEAKFLIATGVTLTLNCTIYAGLNQIFSWAGTGKVLFGDGTVTHVYPEWWGALKDGTDGSAAIQACFTASMNSTFRPKIVFQTAIYTHATALTITYPQGIRLEGAAGGYYTPQAAGYTNKVTTLYYTGSGNALTLGDGGTSNGTGFNCSNIYFKGTSSATGGVILNVVSGLVFRDCTIGQFTKSGGYGLYQTNGQTNSFYNCAFINNYFGTSLGVGTAENSTTRFYDCVWHSNTNHAFKMEHGIGSIVLYSPLFQDNAGSAIFADGTVGPKPLHGLKVYDGYVAGSNASVAGVAIDIRGSNDGGAGSWAKGIVLRDLYFATPGAAQTASIRLRNTDGAVIDNPNFGSIATTEIIAAPSDNNKLNIENWKYASTYIKDAAGGNVVYWNKVVMEDEFQRIFRGGDVLIHQEDTAGAVAPLTLQQSDISEPIIRLNGSTSAGTGETFSSLTTPGSVLGHVKIDWNGTPVWVTLRDDPS